VLVVKERTLDVHDRADSLLRGELHGGKHVQNPSLPNLHRIVLLSYSLQQTVIVRLRATAAFFSTAGDSK